MSTKFQPKSYARNDYETKFMASMKDRELRKLTPAQQKVFQKIKRQELHDSMINELSDCDNITEWESQFLSTINPRFVSVKQQAMLEDIYNKRTVLY